MTAPRSVQRSRGFTLIEMGVVLGLLALALAIAVPSVNALTGARLRTSATMASGMMREAYARAAITGKVHRMVLDIDEGAFWLERTDERFVLAAERAKADTQGRGGETLAEREEAATEALRERVSAAEGREPGDIDPLAILGLAGEGGGGGGGINALEALNFDPMAGPGQSSTMGNSVSVDEDLEEALKKRLRRRARFSPVEDEVGKPQILGGDVRFHRRWVEHQEEAFVGGSSEIYFFPTGYTERAIIMLTDDEHGERVISIELNPLTARTRVLDEELEVPR